MLKKMSKMFLRKICILHDINLKKNILKNEDLEFERCLPHLLFARNYNPLSYSSHTHLVAAHQTENGNISSRLV